MIITYIPAPGYTTSERGNINIGSGSFDVNAALAAGSGVITVDTLASPQLALALDSFPGVIRQSATPGPPATTDTLSPVYVHSKGSTPGNALVLNADGTTTANAPPGTTQAESVTTITAAGAAQTLTAPTSGKITYDITASAATCALTLTGATSNVLAQVTAVLRQDATGNRAWTFSANVNWPNGQLPPLSTAPGRYDIITFVSTDGGTTWTAALASTNTAPIVTPSQPTITVNAGNTQNAISWNAPNPGGAPITSYVLQRSTTTNTETDYQTIAAGAVSYTDTGLTNGTTYFYKLIAVNAGGRGTASAEASGTPVSTGFIDSGPSNLTVTAVGAPTLPSKVTSPLGGAFNNAVNIPSDATTLANLELPNSFGVSSNFTLEAAIELASAPTAEAGIIGKWGTVAADQNIYMFLTPTGQLSATFVNSGGSIVGPINSGATVITDTTTTHWVAASWDGTSLRIYIDGTLVGTQTLGANSGIRAPSVGAPTCIGCQNPTNKPFVGVIDEVRISSTARYTGASYTVPSTPFTSDASTLALLHMD